MFTCMCLPKQWRYLIVIAWTRHYTIKCQKLCVLKGCHKRSAFTCHLCLHMHSQMHLACTYVHTHAHIQGGTCTHMHGTLTGKHVHIDIIGIPSVFVWWPQCSKVAFPWWYNLTAVAAVLVEEGKVLKLKYSHTSTVHCSYVWTWWVFCEISRSTFFRRGITQTCCLVSDS